jgi:hypothetical protein
MGFSSQPPSSRHGRTPRRRGGLACLLLVGGLLPAPPARAQLPGHPGVPALEERPLHARLDRADAVVVGRVESVEAGRIRVRVVEPVLGRAPEAFELKRAPSHPPPLVPGESALLLLRGARSPYLLVDEPSEVVPINGAAALTLWRRALRALDEASTRPAQITRIYAGWLAEESVALRRAGVIGLGAPESDLPRAGAAAESRLAALAVAPDLGPLVRLCAASAALRTPAGREALLGTLPGGEGADAQVLATGVQGAVRSGADVRRVLIRAPPTIRRTGARLSTLVAQEGELRERLVEMTAEDPDEGVRLAARRALGG